MCKAPKPPKAKEPDKPEWLRNPYLDASIGQAGAVNQMRTGRSSLRTDLSLRTPGAALSQPTNTPQAPANTPRPKANPLDAWRARLPSIGAAF